MNDPQAKQAPSEERVSGSDSGLRLLDSREPRLQAGLVAVCCLFTLLPAPVNLFFWAIVCFHFADRGWGGGLYSPVIKTSVALLPKRAEEERIDPGPWIAQAQKWMPLAMLSGIAGLELPLGWALAARIPAVVLLALTAAEAMDLGNETNG